MDVQVSTGPDTASVNLLRRLWPAVLWALLPLWLAASVLLLALRGEVYPADYALLLAVPAAASRGIVRVSGTVEHGRYLLRKYGSPSAFGNEARGWSTVCHEGNGYSFKRGKERLSGTCGRFGHFEVCDLSGWAEK